MVRHRGSAIGTTKSVPVAQEAAAVSVSRGEQIGAAKPPARAEAPAKDPRGDTLGVNTVAGPVDDIAQRATVAAKTHAHRHVAQQILINFNLITPVAVARRVHEAKTEIGQRQHA